MAQDKTKKLSKHERTVALAMLSVGVSRESASRSIGMSSDSIQRLFATDDSFAKEVLKAEEEAEQFYIGRIREATADPRAWRAAAWMLERRLPDRYGVSKADILTAEAVLLLYRFFLTPLI